MRAETHLFSLHDRQHDPPQLLSLTFLLHTATQKTTTHPHPFRNKHTRNYADSRHSDEKNAPNDTRCQEGPATPFRCRMPPHRTAWHRTAPHRISTSLQKTSALFVCDNRPLISLLSSPPDAHTRTIDVGVEARIAHDEHRRPREKEKIS